MGEIVIDETFRVKGNREDWELIETIRYEHKGEARERDKVRYFPNLYQVARYYIENAAKASSSMADMVAALEQSTARVVEALGGVQPRKIEVQIVEQEPQKIEQPKRRRRRSSRKEESESTAA